MRIFFSIIDDWRGESRDVWLEGDPDSPLSSLFGVLDPSGAADGQGWWDGDRLLSPSGRLGADLRDGAVLARRAPVGPDGWTVEPAVVLRAVAGAHAGQRWPLPAGPHLIGRSDEARINLVEDRWVSRRHALIDVRAGAVTVRDEGSAHGSTIDGDPVTEGPLPRGSLLQVGDTVLAWDVPDEERAAVVSDGEGGLLYNRPPRIISPAGPATVRYPGSAPVRTGVNFPLMASVAPVILGVAMAVLFHNPQWLLFTLLSPVMAISNFVSQRRSGTRSFRDRSRAHVRAVEAADADLDSVLRWEMTARRASTPDAAILAAVALGPQRRLWERRRTDLDFLRLRIGQADQPADVTVEGRSGESAGPGGPGPGGAPDGEHPLLRQVPALVDLVEDGVLGIAGDRRLCESLARGLLVQAATLHAPDELVVTVLSGSHQHEEWGWARWLPHARDREGRTVARIGSTDAAVTRLAGDLATLVDERLSPGPASTGAGAGLGALPAAHLVVLDGAYRLGALPAITKALRHGPAVGMTFICLDDEERLLPEECQAVAVFDPDSGSPRVTLRTRRTAVPTAVLGDLVGLPVATEIARALAPLRLNRRAAADAVIPTSLRLLDALDLEPPDAGVLAARWAGTDRSTRAVIGEMAMGPLVVDLARDGPHGLVAGTTGSGKSELLQSLIASLAAANRPDLMNFVLIDYKGGSAFKECAELPHTVGMVTDLDGHLTERALASLAAELRRREHVLARVGARDIEGYWRAAGPEQPSMARLLLVIDEFAALVEELPSFVDGLVDLARRGRSLGIHLILATQRPSGVVSAAIKTNTNLRIAMRVTDAADSTDVIDSPLAARISKAVPGRGYVRVGHEELSEFQAARIGGRRPLGGGRPIELHSVRWEDLGLPLPEPDRPALAAQVTDLSVLVTSLADAAERLGIAAPDSPWLPPLPEQVVVGLDGAAGGAWVPRLAAPYGLEDHPGEQAQRPAYVDLESHGHLLAIGDPGSGRSTLLRTIAASLAARVGTADVHMYGIDCGNGALLALDQFPQCGAIVTRREPDRVDRLLTKLLAQVTERQQVLARGGFATIADQRAAAPPAERLPYLVVLLDRWEGFNAEFEALDNGRLISSFLHLMREGPGVGVRVIVTGDRSATSARFSSLADQILMLRLNDRTVYAAVGLNPKFLPEHMAPGRAFHARGGTEVQVALLDPDPSGPAQVAAISKRAAQATERDALSSAAIRPDPIAVLPVHVSLAELLECPVGTGGSPVALVGVGGDHLEPLVVDFGRHGPGFVVAGPPRSGRTNTLMAMVRSLTRGGCAVIAVTARPSALTGLRGTPGVVAVVDGRTVPKADFEALLMEAGGTGLGEGGGTGLIEGGGTGLGEGGGTGLGEAGDAAGSTGTAPPPLAVVIDDAELLADAPIGEAISGFLRTARDRAGAVILAGTTSELGVFRGFIPDARKSRAGLLLCPGAPGDGEILGVRLPRTAVFLGPPGRGLLIAETDMTLVQVPFDDSDASG